MRFSLRTLLIVMLLGGPALAGVWWGWEKYEEYRRQRQFDELIDLIESTVAPQSWTDIGSPSPKSQD